MSLYSLFETDQDKEQNGVRVEYPPNDDGTIPTFIVARMSASNKRYSKALARETKPFQRLMQLEQLDNDTAEAISIKVFCASILLGWENVQARDGSLVPYSEATARELLQNLPDLYADLRLKANQAGLYRHDDDEDAAKN